ncbi:MAG: hypothetical protein IH987_02160 [Planctomycetes bacterium]|nr:hypothetical protein [Planctomycetota bacterium]
MQFYGKAETVATRIIEAFERGDVPKALAPIFIKRAGRHCDTYSWCNQLIVALSGHADAMGYKDWKRVGRQVRKGERATLILAPCKRKVTRNDSETGETREAFVLYGFRSTPVFGIEQTDVADDDKWAKHNKGNEQAEQFLESLPLRSVAESWGLKLQAYSGKRGKALGWYRHGSAIALGVENLATWAHELVHAADFRNGKLIERGQHWRSETVAELGGAILLSVLGFVHDADLGGCWNYVEKYVSGAEIEPIVACSRVLSRMCDAVALILNEADRLASPVPDLATA